ncbi:MAG: polyribonucleotide nucleotidyltransferase [Alphaproteobacteria bacterium]|nr:polyribonucleotide nucleotidyltransferase [Alphaproteobacteria bacterium]
MIETIKMGSSEIKLETGRVAKLSKGSVLATWGETVVLATVVSAKEAKAGQDFFPLSVHYQERFSSIGQFPKGYIKRETKPTDGEVLKSRLIDRALRPLFPSTYFNEVQVIITVYSFDGEHASDILAGIAASAAVSISGIPFAGPVAFSRVAQLEGKLVSNPSLSDLKESDLDLVVAGTKDGVLMVESEAKSLTEKQMLDAVKEGHKSLSPILKAITALKKAVGTVEEKAPELSKSFLDLEKASEKKYGKSVIEAFKIETKPERSEKLQGILKLMMEDNASKIESEECSKKDIDTIFDKLQYKLLRASLIKGDARIDKRDSKTIRPIEIETGVLPSRVHGSALFTRGETQSLMSVVIGTEQDAQKADSIYGNTQERFMLQYNFPGFSVGEVKRVGAVGRREIGHAKLAMRALTPVMPSLEEFDYTIKVISDITQSNGSSSMATVCGGCVAMMHAGIPLKSPVAGIAMGLIKEGEDYVILSDILGDEDHLGDMDFKVAGTKEGITALQMDIKITSLTFEIMEKALAQAQEGRLHILEKMIEVQPSVGKLSEYAPRTETIKINPLKIRDVIGKGGAVIQKISAESQATINIEDDGTISISGTNPDYISSAKEMIKAITAEAEAGKVYEGTVVSIKDFGAFIRFFEAQEGLVHISNILPNGEHLVNVEDALEEGQKVKVYFSGVDNKGRSKLSMSYVEQSSGELLPGYDKVDERKERSGGRDNRGGSRGGYNRDNRGGSRDNRGGSRGGYNRDNRGGSRDSRGGSRGGYNRDDRGGSRGRDDRNGGRRDNRSDDRNDRGSQSRDSRPTRNSKLSRTQPAQDGFLKKLKKALK